MPDADRLAAPSAATTTVWITGASRGLGAALATTVPFPGARVLDVSRSGGSPTAEHVPADLADPSSWVALQAHFLAQLADGVERAVLVHSAGLLAPIGFAGEVDTAAYRDLVLLDAAAPQVLGHAFLTAVREAGVPRADLVLLSSGAATTVYEGWSAYGAGKAAVDQWVRTVGAEQQRRGGVRVLAVAPGVVATGMQELIRSASPHDFPAVEKFADLHASGRLREPEEAARQLWSLLDRDDVTSGSVVDLRDLDG